MADVTIWEIIGDVNEPNMSELTTCLCSARLNLARLNLAHIQNYLKFLCSCSARNELNCSNSALNEFIWRTEEFIVDTRDGRSF